MARPMKLIERGQVYFQCGEEMTTGRDLELLGDQCLFWASDFPHEGIVDMSKAVEEFLSRDDIPAASKKKISYDNLSYSVDTSFKAYYYDAGVLVAEADGGDDDREHEREPQPRTLEGEHRDDFVVVAEAHPSEDVPEDEPEGGDAEIPAH